MAVEGGVEMDTWQQAYLANIARISALRKIPSGASPAETEASVSRRREEIRLSAPVSYTHLRAHET